LEWGFWGLRNGKNVKKIELILERLKRRFKALDGVGCNKKGLCTGLKR